MSKLHRSMLWSGLLVAGIAACGDDVTIPGPPEPTVRSISVAPNGVTVGVGANVITMSAAVNADAGVTNLAVTWSTSDPTKASVNQNGQVTTLAQGSVAIIACSQLVPAVCGNATLIISANAPTVNTVTVVPNAPFINRGGSVTLVASVQGTNAPAQTVTWVSANPAAVSVGASTGVVTAAANAPAGTVAITACSTVAGFTNVCGSSAVTVVIPDPAQVFIASVTNTVGGVEVPVVLTNVGGQIQINTQINTGAQQISRVDALIGGVVVASQSFAVQPSAVRAEGEEANVVLDLTLSTDTRQLRRNGTLFLPVVFNGNQAITAHLYVVGATLPVASNAIPVVMANVDRAVKVGTALTLVNNSSNPSFTDGLGNVWFTGTQSAGAVNYISFSTVAPSAVPFGSTICGSSNSTQTTGTPTTGLSYSGTFNCTNVEGANSLTGVAFGGIVYPTLVGPDGTVVTPAAGFSNVGTAFCVPKAGVATFTNLPPNCDANSDQRWNMITPGTNPTIPAAVRVDNKAPVVTPNEIGFMAGCSATIPIPGCWINGAYNLAGDFVAVDGGTGVNVVNTFSFDPLVLPNVCTNSSLTPASALEDASPTKYNACGRATDNIGNVSSAVFGFNAFGVDKTNPTITYAIDPLLVGMTLYAPAATLAQQLLEAVPATQRLDWRVNDNNAGLDTATALQVATAGTTLNGACVISIDGALNAEPAPGADRYMIPANAPFPDAGCAIPGYYHYQATVTDRAGNSASDVNRRFGFEPGVPAIAALAPTLLYGGGNPATVTVFASHSGASLSNAKVGIWYTSNAPVATPTPVQLVYDQGQLFNAPFQTPLALTTPITGTALTVAGSSVLAGLVIDSTEVPVSSFDSVTAIIGDVFHGAGFTGALVHADTADLVIPAPFIDPAKVSTSGTVWANPQMGAATFSGAGACTFTYATPTNGPTIPSSVLVVRTLVANIYDVLFPITAAPTLISDNGTTRVYRYSVSGSTCASFGGTLRLIAVKNDLAGLPVGYLVP